MADRIRDMSAYRIAGHVESCAELRTVFTALACRFVGHVGYTRVTNGLAHAGYRIPQLAARRIRLGEIDRPFASPCRNFPYDDVMPFGMPLSRPAARPVIWLDWPHVMLTGDAQRGDLLDAPVRGTDAGIANVSRANRLPLRF